MAVDSFSIIQKLLDDGFGHRRPFPTAHHGADLVLEEQLGALGWSVPAVE
jgi:hypothetical protein